MSKNGTEIYYDTLAQRYDELTAPVGAWNAPVQTANAITKFNPGASSLIIGIGTGLDVAPLVLAGATHIEGVDLSQSMLDKCKIKYPSLRLHHADFMREFTPDLASFDSLVCSGTSEFIPDISGFFNKCAFLMNPGAHLFFTFEPVIDYHAIQKKSCSIPLSTATGKPAPVDFTTYRRPLFYILGLCRENKLEPVFHSEYVTQRKSENDVIYHLLVLRRLSNDT